MSDADDNFVSRWSRLKRTQDSPEETADLVPAEPNDLAPQDSDAEATPSDPDEIVKNLPDISTMTEEMDFTVFLKDGVPEDLRNRALRHLWRLNPVFANVDGLNDYDLDYTDAAMAVKGVLKTLHQIGKGMPGPEPKEEEEEAVVAAVTDSAAPDSADHAEDGEIPVAESQDETDDGNVKQSLAEEGTDEGTDDKVALSEGPAAMTLPDSLGTNGRERATVDATPPSGTAARRRWARFTT